MNLSCIFKGPAFLLFLRFLGWILVKKGCDNVINLCIGEVIRIVSVFPKSMSHGCEGLCTGYVKEDGKTEKLCLLKK